MMFTILVADDESLERKAIRHIVNRECPDIGEVIEASNGLEAIEAHSSRKPDIVFMDIKMPGLNGLEAAREIRKRTPDQCIVFLTAYDYFDYAREAISIGAVEYLLKPVDDGILVDLVSNLCGNLRESMKQRARLEETEERLKALTEFFHNEYLSVILEKGSGSEQLDYCKGALPPQHAECVIAAVSIDFASFPLAIIGTDQRELLRRRTLSLLKNEIEYRLNQFMIHVKDGLIYFALFPKSGEESQYSSPASVFDLFTSVAGLVQERISVGLITALTKCKAENAEILEALLRTREAISRGDACDGVILCDAEVRSNEHTCPDRQALSPRLLNLMDGVRQKVEREYMTALSLDAVADSAGLSSFYFSKVFKAYSGQTFIDYLNGVRLRHAKEALSDPRISVKEAAAQTGFSDANYFSRVFKGCFGETPSEWKNRTLTAKL